MKASTILLAALFLSSILQPLFGQSLAWVKTTGTSGTSELYPTATAVDASKNVFTVGSFTGAFDFNPDAGVYTLSTLPGVNDVYVQKLDSNGAFVWAVAFNGNGNSGGNALHIDGAGNVFVSGNFNSPVDFDPGAGVNLISPTGDQDAFVMKLDGNGTPIWVHHFGAALHVAAAQAMITDNSNNIILSGYYQDMVDFDPGAGVMNLTATGWADNFIVKLDPSGSLVYAQSLSGTDFIDVYGLSVDPSDNLYMTGTFYGTTDFDPGTGVSTLTSSNSSDLFILKLTAAGNFAWTRQLGNDGYESVAGIASDNLGNVYIAGLFSDSIDIDPGASVSNLYSIGNSDMMVLKLATNGNFIWGKQIGGLYAEQAASVTVDNMNNLFITGYFEGQTDFDPGSSIHNLTSTGFTDVFVSSLDPNGNFRMAENIGGVMDDRGIDIILNGSNNLFCMGLFKDTADFDPTGAVSNTVAQSTFNPGDAFLFRWDLCTTTSTSVTQYHCDSVVLNGITYTATGVYTDVMTASGGCDSIVTLYLTIGNNNSVVNQTQCNGTPYVFNGQTYTSPGTYYQNYTNTAGCDSNFTIHLTYGSPSSYLITDTACDVYFFGTQILNTSGVYTNVVPNVSGCDSTTYLHLTIHHSVYGSMSVSNCGPYTLNGNVYNTSGFYSIFMVTANGCDSVIDLDLIIVPNTGSSQVATACTSYSYNGQTYTASGVYTSTFMNMAGCDSVVTLTLTVNHPNVLINQTGSNLTAAAAAPATYQWINCTTGNTPIAGATSQSYVAVANGSYAVVVTENGCSDTSLCKAVTGVSIGDLMMDHDIKVYPNPVRDLLMIDLGDTFNTAEVSIRTMVGQVLYEHRYGMTHQLEIPLSTWAAGAYFLTVKVDGQQWVTKFVKE